MSTVRAALLTDLLGLGASPALNRPEALRRSAFGRLLA